MRQEQVCARAGAYRHLAALATVAFGWIIGLIVAGGPVRAQSTMVLAHNHPPAALRNAAIGAADGNLTLSMHLVLALRNRAALEQELNDLQNPASQVYHQWLTPAQFAQRFGPDPATAAAIAEWLRAQGLRVSAIDAAARTIAFSGTVAQAERAFGTRIMTFGDGSIYANIADPVIPAQFADQISAVTGLDNMLHAVPAGLRFASARAAPPSPPRALRQDLLERLEPTLALAPPDVIISPNRAAFGPGDFYTFYDEAASLRATTGSGCIGIVGDSDVLPAALAIFYRQFGLPQTLPSEVLADRSNPGITGNELEALLDLEWSHAAAPQAAQVLYLDNPAVGSLVDALAAAINSNTCATVNISFSFCGEAENFYTQTLDPLFAQAAAQGQSVFVPSGDWGAAGLVYDPTQLGCVPATSRNISEMAGDPNVTAVGGSSFSPNYDSSGNDTGFVPESVLNDSGRSVSVAGGGGASVYFTKPAYQNATGVPADGARDIPDVALLASPYSPGVYFGADNGGNGTISCCAGGTSLAAPIWAGIGWLLAQQAGGRVGNINPRLYQLAASGQSAGLRDITTGNNNYNGVTGFQAQPGYDQASGWGTVDIREFVTAFVAASTATATPTASASATPTPTPAPVPSSTPASTPLPTTKPTITPSPVAPPATPTAAPTPGPEVTPIAGGTVMVPQIAKVQAAPGSTIMAGQFAIGGASGVAQQISSIALAVSDPALFTSLTLTATIGDASQSASVDQPGPTTVFTFAPALSLPAGATAKLVLTAVIAPNAP